MGIDFIIVPDKMRHIDGFIQRYRLDPRSCIKVIDEQDLPRQYREIPVVITYCNSAIKQLRLDRAIKRTGFKTYTYRDY